MRQKGTRGDWELKGKGWLPDIVGDEMLPDGGEKMSANLSKDRSCFETKIFTFSQKVLLHFSTKKGQRIPVTLQRILE